MSVPLLDWFNIHRDTIVPVLLGVSVLTFVGSVVLIPLFIARMPADYFLYRSPPRSRRLAHRVLRGLARLAKNLVGAVLLLAGILMVPLPGQGALTILMALVLLDYPGKRRLELSVIRRPTVYRAVGWIRRRADRPPLELPDAGH